MDSTRYYGFVKYTPKNKRVQSPLRFDADTIGNAFATLSSVVNSCIKCGDTITEVSLCLGEPSSDEPETPFPAT